jgi:hypothetical protein
MIEEPDFDKLKKKADAGELNEASLQAELNRYSQALKQEWEDNQRPEDTSSDAEQQARDYFKKHVPFAAAQVVWLAGNSDSDTVRLNASKHIIALGITSGAKDGDPLKELLNELSKNDKKVAKA